MEKDAFQLLANAEAGHWWFRARRDFIAAAMERAQLPTGAKILDAGCGSGGNLKLLSQFGTVSGFEYNNEALGIAAGLNTARVASGFLPDGIPFSDEKFDAVGLFDVLEHLEHPVPSLIALRDRLTANGAIVLTVPANPWLWGPHDVVHQHFRRYTASSLTAHLQSAGLRVEYLSYMNTLLLPLAIAQRVRERVAGYSPENLSPSKFVNETLYRIWRTEQLWIPKTRVPFGLSLIAIARKA